MLIHGSSVLGFLGSTGGMVGVVLGSVFMVVLLGGLAMLVVKRRRSIGSHQITDESGGGLRQFVLPKNVKPVISFKTAAGPGGLKNSPSPLQSPEDGTHARMSTSLTAVHQQNYGSACNSVEMSPVDDIDQTPSASVASGSMNELAHSDDADVTKRGQLTFSLRYSFDKNALQVTVKSASGLPQLPVQPGDHGHLIDPYVKLQLLPEKQHKVKTRVVRNTLSPVYDEDFTFYGLSYNQLQTTTLHFAVVAFDRYSRDEIIGEVICPLHQVDLSDSDSEATLTLDLCSRTSKFQNSENRGELLVSLCYQPATNKLTAVVLKAKNLPKFDITGLADPYVKVYMMYNGQKVAKKKTHVKKRTLTPVYNESFVFDLPSVDPAAMDQISFEFMVMDWDRVTKNEVMGRCMIGMSSFGNGGKSHWDQVRRNPRRQIAEWHRLRP